MLQARCFNRGLQFGSLLDCDYTVYSWDRLLRAFWDDDISFKFQRLAGEEVAPRFKLLYEQSAVIHRLEMFDRATGIVSERLCHGFDSATACCSDTSDIEGVAVVVFDDQVESAFSFSPVESQWMPPVLA